jgi:hypothetical protein
MRDHLPESFVIYQGRGSADEALGLGWTLDPRAARWYGHRWALMRRRYGMAGKAVTYRARVEASSLLAFRRLTKELVVDPALVQGTEIVSRHATAQLRLPDQPPEQLVEQYERTFRPFAEQITAVRRRTQRFGLVPPVDHVLYFEVMPYISPGYPAREMAEKFAAGMPGDEIIDALQPTAYAAWRRAVGA